MPAEHNSTERAGWIGPAVILFRIQNALRMLINPDGKKKGWSETNHKQHTYTLLGHFFLSHSLCIACTLNISLFDISLSSSPSPDVFGVGWTNVCNSRAINGWEGSRAVCVESLPADWCHLYTNTNGMKINSHLQALKNMVRFYSFLHNWERKTYIYTYNLHFIHFYTQIIYVHM